MLHTSLLAASDVIAMFLGLTTAYAVRLTNPATPAHPISFESFAGIAAAESPLWLTTFGLLGLYTREGRRLVGHISRIIVGAAFGVAALIILNYLQLTQPLFPSRAVAVFGFLFGTAFVLSFRATLRLVIHFAYSRGFALHRVVILGSNDIAIRLLRAMSRRGTGYDVVAVVSAERDGRQVAGIPVFSEIEAARRAVGEPIDEIVQADFGLDHDHVARLVAWARSHNVAYRFVPDLFGIYASASRPGIVDGLPVLQVRETSLDGWHSVAKRTFDLTAGCIILLLLVPVLLVVSLVIKFRDPRGPIFYHQDRIGRGGRQISVMKFRSMMWQYSTGPGRPYANAEEAFMAMGRADLCAEFARDQKVQDDPRVSAVGRLLRKTSLDELPQLLNVIKGDLSLIGPRPITPEELERYGAKRFHLLALKPGVTGLWQVSGRSDVSYEERVSMDVSYAENWTFGLDMKILAKTPIAVLAKRGAV